MSYNFDKKFQGGKYSIQVDTKAMYGYFEHDVLGDERAGGLWFDLSPSVKPVPDSERLELIDYDGMPCLPKDVVAALRENDFIVDEDFE